LFKHLDNSRQEIKQIETGDRQKLSENVPTEIYPLVKEFNHSLSSMQQRIERSRNALGNLAHALKTPLSLLMQNLEQAQEPSQANNPKHLESALSQAKKQAERIRQLTDRELKRARLAGLGNSAERFDAEQELATLINVLKQAHPNKQLEISCQIANEVKPFADREDMIELLGNLLDNAFKWAEGHVICHITQHTNTINLCIEDDGKGITASALTQLTQRGIRLDESVEGHGLGLAICKDIVNIYNGKIHFEQSVTLGGLSVTVSLPQNPQ
jgi:signal transduction histidine kinase